MAFASASGCLLGPVQPLAGALSANSTTCLDHNRQLRQRPTWSPNAPQAAYGKRLDFRSSAALFGHRSVGPLGDPNVKGECRRSRLWRGELTRPGSASVGLVHL